MKRGTARSAALALVALVVLAGVQSRHLAERRREGLPAAYSGYGTDIPPMLNFILLGLGGFRGIAAEILWLRADQLQEEGRFIELVQLADWITRLDPHASEAWSYNAWNLAYNVSAMMIRPKDRLRWVNNGISLLRDAGIPYNPRDARLYRELAWLYQNKIGDTLDEAHLAYKLDLAATMSPLLNADGTFRDTPEHRAVLASLRLDASRMKALEARFGPLDWRMAESHAVYWAIQGAELAEGDERLLCRRGVYQPLILSVFRGRFNGSLADQRWNEAPNLALARSTADYLDETLREFPSRTMSNVVLRFLTLSTRRASQIGLDDLARDLYARLCRKLPQRTKKPTFDDVASGWDPPDES